MHFSSVESEATLHQTDRIAEYLRTDGIDVQIARNEWNEPLAVVARDVLDPHAILGSVSLHDLNERLDLCTATDEESEARFAAITTLPVAGMKESLVLPASFLHVIDLALQAAMDDPNLLATELENVPVESDPAESRRWLDTHIDHSNHMEIEIEDRLTSGLNINVTWSGSCSADFGLVRSFADVQRIGAKNEMDRIARELGAPFTERVELNPGDAVIFQAGPHRKLGRLPVAHEFLTTGDGIRHSELYMPTGFAPAAVVLPQRLEVARNLQLEHLGYTS